MSILLRITSDGGDQRKAADGTEVVLHCVDEGFRKEASSNPCPQTKTRQTNKVKCLLKGKSHFKTADEGAKGVRVAQKKLSRRLSGRTHK